MRILLAAFIGGLGCSSAGGEPGPSAIDAGADVVAETETSVLPCKPKRSLPPSADESAALTMMLGEAAADREVDGPAGKQGRLYLGPGLHRFHDVLVPSNVRIEIDPGATLTAVEQAPKGDKAENPLFSFGETTEVHNITITAGDGCGGPGTPTLANKLGSTGDRGNTEVNGMSNMTVPHDPHWPIETFFVFDMDPHFRNVPSGTFAARVGFSSDVTISKFFSIQNPERVTDGSGAGTGPTVNFVRNPVIKPRALRTSTFEAPQMPTRFRLEWVYNVLSPSGWGPVQVQSCIDCSFTHIFSHGGVALRVETDNASPICGHDVCDGCDMGGTKIPPVDDQGHGLAFYARVDGLEGDDIETALGNAAVFLNPHCQHNGRAHVQNVRGNNSAVLVSVGAGGLADGVFDSSSLIENVIATDDIAGKAQDANPKLDTYDLTDTKLGLAWTAATFTAKTAGTFCWPTARADMRNPASAQKPQPIPTFTHESCPSR